MGNSQSSREPSSDDYKAEAKSLSNRGETDLPNEAKAQAKLMAEANRKEVAEALFDKKNATKDVGVLDLHGLFVKEAIEKVEQRIALCKKMGRKDLVVIVGKGYHSRNGSAVLKPMVEEYLQKHGFSFTVGKPNDGCIYVEFDNRGLFVPFLGTCAVLSIFVSVYLADKPKKKPKKNLR